MSAAPSLRFRVEPTPADRAAIRGMVERTGVFRDFEVDVAEELVAERLARGPSSGYEFVFAEDAGDLLGYACFGPVPCTESSWDLYWLAVEPGLARRGVGAAILAEVEKRTSAAGGRRLYAETSGRLEYRPARNFYEARSFIAEAILPDFYAPGDAKYIYAKSLIPPP